MRCLGRYPDGLMRARNHLRDAELALERGDEEDAVRFLAKAELDAELAAAQSNRAKAQVALNEINEGIEDLRRELDRNDETEGS